MKGLSVDGPTNILRHAELTEVQEHVLTGLLLARLRQTVSAGDPERAFENLMWWLVTAAEKQQKLTRAKVVDKINQIGTFLSDLAAHNHEWNISIKPILAGDQKRLDRAKLEREFFLGGRVRVQHIASGLDVRQIQTPQQNSRGFQE